jgi:hypothetical protein
LLAAEAFRGKFVMHTGQKNIEVLLDEATESEFARGVDVLLATVKANLLVELPDCKFTTTGAIAQPVLGANRCSRASCRRCRGKHLRRQRVAQRVQGVL